MPSVTKAQLLAEVETLRKSLEDESAIRLELEQKLAEALEQLQDKNSALTKAQAQVTEALEQQTATAEILRVISSSPTDVQPVFEAIVRNAVRLCGAAYGGVYRFDGELIHSVAHHNFTPEQLEEWRQSFPRPVSKGGVIGRAIATAGAVRVADFEAESESMPEGTAVGNLRALGVRSGLAVPMFQDNQVIGGIALNHRSVGAFSHAHVEMLQTFADQAVIAIENVRLFTELQASNRELTTALDTQTATSDILRVISQSQTDVQPVFDAILGSAVRLLGGSRGR